MHKTDWHFVSKGLKDHKIIEYYVCLVDGCRKPFILFFDGDELPEEH